MFGLFAAFFAVCFLFRWRVRTAGQWEASGRPLEPSDRNPHTFERVNLQHEPPRPSFRAYRDWQTGRISTDPDGKVARFANKDASLDLNAIHQVAIGKYGNDRVNTYVRVEYGVGEIHVAYLRDSGWSGLGNLFTGSNLRLARAIAACAA